MAKRGVTFADDGTGFEDRKGGALSGTTMTCLLVGAFVLLVLMPALIGPPDDDPMAVHGGGGFPTPPHHHHQTGAQSPPTTIPQSSGRRSHGHRSPHYSTSRNSNRAFLRPLPPHLSLDRFDVDGDGKLDDAEVDTACRTIFDDYETTWDCGTFDSSRYDDNHNHQLERSEWMVLVRDHYLEDASTRISLYSLFLYPTVVGCLLVVAGVLVASLTVLQWVLGLALPLLFLMDWFVLTDGLFRAGMALLIQVPVVVTTVAFVSKVVFRGGPVPRRLKPSSEDASVRPPPSSSGGDGGGDGDGDGDGGGDGNDAAGNPSLKDDQRTETDDTDGDEPEQKADPSSSPKRAAKPSSSFAESALRSTVQTLAIVFQLLHMAWSSAFALALWCTAKRRSSSSRRK